MQQVCKSYIKRNVLENGPHFQNHSPSRAQAAVFSVTSRFQNRNKYVTWKAFVVLIELIITNTSERKNVRFQIQHILMELSFCVAPETHENPHGLFLLTYVYNDASSLVRHSDTILMLAQAAGSSSRLR